MTTEKIKDAFIEHAVGYLKNDMPEENIRKYLKEDINCFAEYAWLNIECFTAGYLEGYMNGKKDVN
jgi:hypothetical protein